MRISALLAVAIGISGCPVFAQVSMAHPFTTSGIYAAQTPHDPAPSPSPSNDRQQPDPSVAAAPSASPPAPFNRSTISGYKVREKFIYDTKNVFGPVPLLFNAVGAGFGQLLNSPKEWGQGATGYADRFASSFGTNFAHQYIGFGLESVLHEDPRYMLSADRSVKGRLKSVLRQTVRARKDAGGETIAYARLGSAFGAGFLANAWQPDSVNSVGDGLERGAEILAFDIGSNFAQEFIPVLRRFQMR